ncbi:MAG: DUF748 domain-containing protein [Verrucomicrobia bacterium]|nr:DUF748 domain-containing protein [Verrucomicrobiota bacterium]
MSENENEISYTPSAGAKWLRRLLVAAGVAAVTLVIAYFTVTSTAFLKAVVLPKVGQAIQGEVTVSDATISPFSQVILRQLKVRTTSSEPLLQADEVRVRYALFDLLGGAIKLDDIAIVSPTVTINEQADGTSNLDPLLKLGGESKPKPVGDEKPLELALKKVALQQATVHYRRALKDGTTQTADVANFDLTLEQLQNGGTGKLTVALDLKVEQTPKTVPAPATPANDQLQARLAGTYDFALDAKLVPQTIKGSTRLDVAQATGLFSELAALSSSLECDLTPTEIRQLGVRFERAGKGLGQVRVSGPVELAKQEGRFKIEVLSIDRQVLNVFGVTRGWDFAQTVLNASNVVDVSRGGLLISARGRLDGARFSIQQQGQATPALDFGLDYQLSADLTDKSAVLHKLSLAARQGQTDLLRGTLDRPMNLNWGGEQRGFTESTFQLAVNELNLADWRPFLPTNAPAGKVSAKVSVVAQKDGRLLRADLSASVKDLAARFGTNEITQAAVDLKLLAQVEDFQKVHVERGEFAFAQRGQPLVTGKGSGDYDLATQQVGGEASLEAALPGLLKEFPVPDLSAVAGTVKFSGSFALKDQRQTLTGNLVLADFTGGYGEFKFQNYQATVDYDVELKGNEVQLRRVALAPRQGFEPGGSFDLSGKLELEKKSGQLTYKTVAVNQNALRPFLAPFLAPRTLTSVSLDVSGAASFNAQGETSAQTEVELRDLLVKDPENKLPSTPLSVKFAADVTQRQAVTELRKLHLSLTPTERARNELQVTGRIDLSPTNPAPSALTIKADALDVTPYYDLFVAKPQTNGTAATRPSSAPPPAASGPEKEPDPVQLPFELFACDLSVGRLYLHDLAISNFVAGAKINKGQLTLNPVKLVFNGAPASASADLNLSVPGFAYKFALETRDLPLAPLVDSFQPERQGQVSGTLTADAQVSGAGVTGASLQKNLAGRFAFASTNLNVSVDKLRNKALKAIVDLVAALPELRRNPAAGVAGLLARWTGSAKATDSWVDELMKSPINTISARGVIGQGRVDLQQALVRSPAFLAEAQGAITLAAVLTNSPIDLPLTLSLRRSLAEKADLLPVNAAPDGEFVPLPKFAKLTGTVGAPETKTDKTVLAGMFLKTATGLIGGKTGNVLQGLGNLLTGQPATAPPGATPPAGQQPKAATNQAPQQVSPADLIQGVQDIFKKKKD